ncbi:MAG: AraC family transcriptional regulator [Rhodoferax sp.]|nr:AraC family transcriptional regulator [Rhodoferax sp.]
MNEPKIVQREAFQVVGTKITTNPATPEIPALWQKFAPRMSEVTAVTEPKVSYGVMQNFDPQKGTLEYMAGVSVTSLAHVPDGMTSIDVPPNTYAVFDASMATIEEVFCHIYEKWFPTSNFEHVKAPYFERYDERFDPAVSTSVIEVYIPVKARAPQAKEFV